MHDVKGKLSEFEQMFLFFPGKWEGNVMRMSMCSMWDRAQLGWLYFMEMFLVGLFLLG